MLCLRTVLSHSRVLSETQVTGLRYVSSAHIRYVQQILQQNEHSRQLNAPTLMCYDSNQVGSNHPVEDHRAEGRISTRNPVVGFRPKGGRAAFSSVSDPDSPTDDPAYVFGIFDGHGGPACAAFASKRLFDYIAAYALGSEDQNAREALNILHNAPPAQSPKLTQLLRRMYFSGEPKQEQDHTERLKAILDECIRQPVPRREDGSLDWQVILHRSFHRLDEDISRSALASMQAPAANGHANGSHQHQHQPQAAASDAHKHSSDVLDIEPLTIALSGSVSTVALLQHNELNVAQIGDSGAVLGQYYAQSEEESIEALSAAIIGSLYQNFTFPRPTSSGDASGADDTSASEFQSVYSACIQIFETYLSRWRAIRITEEHKASNEREVLRIRNAHPKSESGTVLRSERLLGQLIPLRAFGDFQLKWPHNTVRSALHKFQAYLLSRSPDWTPKVGTPNYYYSPPYLTASPELLTHKLSERDRFLIMASDGLWDMMSPIHSVRLVATQLLLRAVLDRVSQMDLEGLSSLARINRVLQALLNTRAMLPTNSATLLLRNAIRTAIEHPAGNEFSASASPFSFSVQADPDILPPNVAAALHSGGGGVPLSRADPDYVTSLGLTPFLAAFADQERLTAFRQSSAAASGRRVHYGGQMAVAAKPLEALAIDSQEVSEELFLQENKALFKALTLPRGVARNVMDDITATVLHFRSTKRL